MSNELPKRRGRPPLDPAERKDGNLTFRTRGDLRQRLSIEARKNGRTISEEVEWRLERSLAGISGANSEPNQYFESVRRMLGSEEDFSETVELGMMWGRLKTLYSAINDGSGEWYDNVENLKSINKFFDDKVERMLMIFAARRRQAREGLTGEEPVAS